MLVRPIQRIDLRTDTRDPTSSDDASKGFGYFAHWINTATGRAFLCVDPAVGAAKWSAVDASGTHVATTNPGPNDDEAHGFKAGYLWLNTTTEMLWVCNDASVGAADWVTVGDPAVTINANQHMQALNATNDGDLACGTPIAHTPRKDGLVRVFVNGAKHSLGDGAKDRAFYYSNDNGVNARRIADISAGDYLYVMTSVLGFSLDTSDVIDVIYEV